jgi:hypothetical protein
MTTEEIEKQTKIVVEKVENFCKDIYPHVDSVRVFITKHENNELGTTRYDYGLGNWYAQYGQIKEWSENVVFGVGDKEIPGNNEE